MKLVSGKSNNQTHIRTTAAARPVQSAPVRQAAPAAPVRPAPGAKKVKSAGGRKALLVTAIVLAVCLGALVGVGAYANGLETIYSNVSMAGVDVSGLTVAQAADALVAHGVGADEDRALAVSLPAGVELSVSAKEAGCYLTAPDAAVYAYDACHGGNFLANTFKYIGCALSGLELQAVSAENLNEDYLRSAVEEGAKAASLALMESSIEIGEESITVVKGANAVRIDTDALYETVKDALLAADYAPIKYAAEAVSGSDADEIDLQELYDTVFEAPVSAVYDPETQQATQHVMGRSFDIDAARALWDAAENGDKVVIPLILEEPELTTEALSKLLFADLLAQKSTSLAGSSAARINNITRASAAIDGTVLNPGEEFSFNGTVGQRTTAAGYQAAGAYNNGQVVSEVGGGICQVSSTLYYCTLLSNLEITNRLNHMFAVTYLPSGLDATVSWPSPDFKFKNNSAYPIKIAAWVDRSQNTVSVQIFGSNPDGIRVEMATETWQLADGHGAQSYRLVYDRDGNLLSRTKEASSRYYYHVDPSPSPSESPSPSPSASPSASPSVEPTPSTEPTPTPPTPSIPVTPPAETQAVA